MVLSGEFAKTGECRILFFLELALVSTVKANSIPDQQGKTQPAYDLLEYLYAFVV